MAKKTYIPSAWFSAHFLHKYLTRWQASANLNLTGDQITCWANLIAALAAFLACIAKPQKVN